MNKQGPGKIEYCDFTWGIVTGCHGPNGKTCEYCYARRITQRWKNNYPYGFEPTFWPGRLNDPLARKKAARIFVADMADIMGDWDWRVCGETMDYYRASDLVIKMVLNTVRRCPQHTFLFLTKNPARYAEFDWPENCWCGASSTGPDFAKRCQEMMMYCDANVRFISLEPCLGPPKFPMPGDDRIDLVIMGGQSGHGAPPMRPKDARDMRDWCQENGKKFFFKQWGEWEPYIDSGGLEMMRKVGKKAAGRLLDGREWNELPII